MVSVIHAHAHTYIYIHITHTRSIASHIKYKYNIQYSNILLFIITSIPSKGRCYSIDYNIIVYV